MTPFGRYLRDQRVKAGVSLRKVAKALEVSHVYYGEVERGVRPPLAEERWPAVVDAIPGVKMRDLRRHAEISRPVQLELQDAPPEYQDLGLALARRIRRRDLGDDLDRVLELLRGGEDNDRGRRR